MLRKSPCGSKVKGLTLKSDDDDGDEGDDDEEGDGDDEDVPLTPPRLSSSLNPPTSPAPSPPRPPGYALLSFAL